MLSLSLPRLEPVDVVPAISAESICNQRRPQQEADLITTHAAFELRNHLLIDVIALPHVNAIRIETIGDRPEGTPCKQAGGGECRNERKTHGWIRSEAQDAHMVLSKGQKI
ncbi:hypothetical protein SDC9_194569 [bioreactor metagenome]|uniref:Uncharacterized protein n=1 Tax=bioreactor metagenome TaxID=1076179 RepID=A0A645I782_9ZZZZ